MLKFIYINKNTCIAEFSIHSIEEFELDFLTLKILSGHEFITFISNFDFELKKIDLKKILFLINRYIPKECIKPLNIRELKYESEIMGLDLLAILLRYTKDELLNQYYQT